MSISVFSDKLAAPTPEQIRAELGPSLPWWEQICAFMLEAYQLPGLLSYGGKNYGWNLWFRRGSRPLLSLYPQKSGMTAQIVLGKAEVQKAMALALGEHFYRVLRETPSFHDGLWMFVPLESQRDVEDALQLIQLKSKPRKPLAAGQTAQPS